MIINYTHFGPNIYTPKKRKEDAGFDLLYQGGYKLLGPNQTKKFHTGICVEIPAGYVGLLMTKSSMAALGFAVLGGVIDSGYRGEIIVCLCNTGSVLRTFKNGDKIAQLVIMPVAHGEFHCVEKLSDSERGEGAFGSTN